MPGDPKKPTAAARKAAAKAKQATRDQVLAEKSPTPRKRDTNKSSLLGTKKAAVIKEGKQKRTDRQTYRSEKESALSKAKRISAARADRLKKRFDKNVAKKDRLENEASRGFDTTTPTKKGSVRRTKSAVVEKKGDESTLTRSRSKKVVKSISRDKAMKLKGKLKKANDGAKIAKKENPNDTVSYKGKIMKRHQMEALRAKENAPKETMTMEEFKRRQARADLRDKIDRTGKYKGIPKNVAVNSYAAGGKNPSVPKPGDPDYDERDFRATDKYKKALKKRGKKTRKAAVAKTAVGKKFKSAAARHAHRRVLDFKGEDKYEYKPRKYKPKSDTTYAKGGKFPDLTGDGKVTKADVLKGRGVFKGGGKVPTDDKYKTSDGRTLSKSAARESAIKSIRKTAAKKAAKAHKQGELKGKKIVGYRKAPASVRNLTQKKVAVYEKEQKRKERGEKKVQKYIDKQARKYAPKPKKQRTPRGGSGTPRPGKTVNYAEKQRRGDKIRKFFQKCAGNTCAQKQRKSGGSAAYK